MTQVIVSPWAPNVLTINGVRYVREDAPKPKPKRPSIDPDRWYPISVIADISGIPRSTIARAAREGRIKCQLPAGAQRGKRILGADFIEWANL